MADSPDSSLKTLLTTVVSMGASDLHLQVHMPPIVRVHGTLRQLEGEPVLDEKRMQRLVNEMLTAQQREILKQDREVDAAYAVPGLSRFRVNCFIEQNNLSAVLRRIPETIPNMEELHLPPVVRGFCELHRGLVLVTGPTGSGKSTTLAAMLRWINEHRNAHILTIEDPIEYTHTPHGCVIRQREVARDTHSFSRALRAALREDPDVILVGEMRDLETIEIAISAAETGHLVFSTLHTRSAPGTIDRIIDVFPAGQQQQIRTQLSASLEGVISQTLLPRADGSGRVAAHEILVMSPASRNLIRENKIAQFRTELQTKVQEGNLTMDRSLARLAHARIVNVDVARAVCQDVSEFNRLLRTGGEALHGGQDPTFGTDSGTAMGGGE